MAPMTPLVDASIASALMSPNPVSYVSSKSGEKGKNTKGKDSDGSPEKTEEEAVLTADERFYTVDAAKLQKLCSEKPWMAGRDSSSTSKRPTAKFFETISIGPSAVTKMMMARSWLPRQ